MYMYKNLITSFPRFPQLSINRQHSNLHQNDEIKYSNFIMIYCSSNQVEQLLFDNVLDCGVAVGGVRRTFRALLLKWNNFTTRMD